SGSFARTWGVGY
ncbi:hypothetical protein CISIN_1g0194181mg, partial [Citrus sinensis]